MATLGPTDIERFRSLVACRLGLNFDDTRLGFLAEILRGRIDATGVGNDAYLSCLDGPPSGHEEWRLLAGELTVGETYFFRNIDQFHAFKDVAVADRLRKTADRKILRVLSAGCASGEEAYSLAMILREVLPAAPGLRLLISGVDVNPLMVERARRGLFSRWSLRETPDDARQRWFHTNNRDYILDDEIRAMVTFEERNLVDHDSVLWMPNSYDVIFCRNVLMYFTPEQSQTLTARIERSLAPGGFLFLGHAETLRGLSQKFHLRHTHGTFYYQRRDANANADADSEIRAAVPLPTNEGTPLTTIVDGAASWVDAIRQASERIQSLSETSRSFQSAMAATANDDRAGLVKQVGRAIELLRRERFGEALGVVKAIPPAFSQDPEVLLLRAVLLTHSGDLSKAEETCAELLAFNDMNAGAHYLVALCREAASDRESAVEHDQVAVYLDQGFAMPRLHLGLLARRAGDTAKARRELGQALLLLQREDSSRLLLFGGGFSREALVELCRTELVAAGVSS